MPVHYNIVYDFLPYTSTFGHDGAVNTTEERCNVATDLISYNSVSRAGPMATKICLHTKKKYTKKYICKYKYVRS